MPQRLRPKPLADRASSHRESQPRADLPHAVLHAATGADCVAVDDSVDAVEVSDVVLVDDAQ